MTTQEMVDMYNNNIGSCLIAKQAKLTPSTVRKHLRDAGVRLRTREENAKILSERSCSKPHFEEYKRRSRIDIGKVKELYNSGYSTKDIGEMLGCTCGGVISCMRNHGVPRRNAKEAASLAIARRSGNPIGDVVTLQVADMESRIGTLDASIRASMASVEDMTTELSNTPTLYFLKRMLLRHKLEEKESEMLVMNSEKTILEAKVGLTKLYSGSLDELKGNVYSAVADLARRVLLVIDGWYTLVSRR